MGAEFALLLSKFAGFSRNFLDSVSSIDAYFWNIRYSFWGPISKRNTTGEDPFTSILGHEHQGSAGTSSSSGAGSYAALVLAGGSMSGVCSSVWGLFPAHFLTMRPARPFQNLILLILLENLVLPQPMSNEVSFLFSSFCSVLSYPGSVPTQLLRPFVTLWWWFYNYGLFSYSSYSKHAHIGSSDHYASFLLAPAEA